MSDKLKECRLTFFNYEKAKKFAETVKGVIELSFLPCGQVDYVVIWYE